MLKMLITFNILQPLNYNVRTSTLFIKPIAHIL